MAATHNLIRDAALVAGGEEGVVRLGVGISLQDTLLAPLMLKIAEAHPRLRLQVELGAADRLLPLVHTRELDLVLCATDPFNTTLAYVEVMRTGLMFVAAPSHPLTAERSISIERLAEFACAGPSMPGYTVSAFLGLASTSNNLQAYTANGFGPLLPLVRQGRAALIAPAFLVQEAIRSGELVRLDVQWAGVLAYGGYTTHAASFSPILAKIMGYAVEIGETLQQDWPRPNP
jgi:DNA-binding transcriptional LysR family regulator